MPFVAGKSGNPGGRRKEKPFRDALMVALGGKDGAKLRQLAEQVVKLALAEKDAPLWAIELIVNRLDGAVPEFVEVEMSASDDEDRPFAGAGGGLAAMRAAREQTH